MRTRPPPNPDTTNPARTKYCPLYKLNTSQCTPAAVLRANNMLDFQPFSSCTGTVRRRYHDSGGGRQRRRRRRRRRRQGTLGWRSGHKAQRPRGRHSLPGLRSCTQTPPAGSGRRWSCRMQQHVGCAPRLRPSSTSSGSCQAAMATCADDLGGCLSLGNGSGSAADRCLAVATYGKPIGGEV